MRNVIELYTNASLIIGKQCFWFLLHHFGLFYIVVRQKASLSPIAKVTKIQPCIEMQG